MTHRVAGIYGLGIGHTEREPHYGDNGVQDEREKHVLVERDSLAAKTPQRETKMDREEGWLRLLYYAFLRQHTQFISKGKTRIGKLVIMYVQRLKTEEKS